MEYLNAIIVVIIFVVLYKYLNFAVDKIIGTGHTTSTDCNTDYEIIQLMKLFITSWCKPLKIDPSREICTYVTWAKPFLPNTHLDELIVSPTTQLENV